MNAVIKDVANFFHDSKLELFSILPFDKMRIINQSKFERRTIQNPKSVIIIALPYFTGRTEETNISLYAHSKDYHLFFSDFFKTAKKYFEEKFKGYSFEGYADNSFIDERYGAVISGIGVFGENGTVITKEYGSYVFLGEIITDMPTEDFYEGGAFGMDTDFKHCIKCGRCKTHCPIYKGECSECLSMITQKKGELSCNEIDLMVKYNTVWGCDICQDVCPMNSNIKTTPVDFFYENRINKVSSDIINSMNDEEFSSRAFAWRGRKTILRNTDIYQGCKKEK